MLESLISFKDVKNKPLLTFLWALIIASAAIYTSNSVPVSIGVDPGFIAVLFVIIPSAFFITLLIRKEERFEEDDIERHITKNIMNRHIMDIFILLLYFSGVTLAFSVAAIFYPENQFGVQTQKIAEIRLPNGQLTAGVVENTSPPAFFSKVFVNNMQVLIFSFLFSFIFGAGSIFIIVWNASILGVVIGQLSKASLPGFGTSIFAIPVVAASFLPHGLPEIAGYITAALAGGILSTAIIRKHGRHVLTAISIDSMKLLTLSVALILLGAVIEAFFVINF